MRMCASMEKVLTSALVLKDKGGLQGTVLETEI